MPLPRVVPRLARLWVGVAILATAATAVAEESVTPFSATLVTSVPAGTYQQVASFSRDVPAGKLLIITDVNARFFTAGPSDDPYFFTLWVNPQQGEVHAQRDFTPTPISGSRVTRLLNAHVELYSYHSGGNPLRVTISRPEGRSRTLTCVIRLSGRLVAWP